MDASMRSPGYDLFKLMVAILLLILFLFLLRRSPSQAVGSSSTLFPTHGIATPSRPPAVTEERLTANPTDVPASPTSPALTSTPSAIPLPTEANEPTLTILPSPTGTSVTEPPASPIAETPVASACDAADARSRLQIGTNATILRRLNFRSSPGIRDNWILTNIPGTQVEIIGGPECLPYWAGAYMWWQIQLPDGRVGWSAEGSLHGSFYFIEPIR